MRSFRFIAPAAAALLLLLPASSTTSAWAWSTEEHRIVCEIAWLSLTDEGRAFVEEVRADDPEPGRLFRESCMWADDVRHSTHRSTDTYHYINIPPDAERAEAARDCPTHDCTPVAIERYAGYLARPTRGRGDARRRAEALKFLAHFVADLHQPLHAGRAADRGGNGIAVSWFGKHEANGRPINLHQVWDRLIGRRAGLRAPAAAGELLQAFSDDPAADEPGDDPWRWATESHLLAEQAAYRLPADRELGGEYFDRALPIVRRQLWLAGIRLARAIEKSRAGAG